MQRIVALIALIFFSFACPLAHSQEPTPPIVAPVGDELKELLCRMVVGNLQQQGPFVRLYERPDGTWPDGGYALLTGFYDGELGWSVHGPTLDDPTDPRFMKNGMQFMNVHAAKLREVGQAFRNKACDGINPDPDPKT